MNKLTTQARAQILTALAEGNSINATCRMLTVNKVTVLRLLADAGTFAQLYHDAHVRGLDTEHVQCDEIWAFVHCKKANTPKHLLGVFGVGDVWTWTGLDSDSKLMIQWRVGRRDTGDAVAFMRDLASRLNGHVQVTTDGLQSYEPAVAHAFGVSRRSDYAQCIKEYGDETGLVGAERKYSPGRCTGVEIKVKWGDPDPDEITTSHVERANLTVRMGNRRFTRLTNGFSKKVENHRHMLAIQFLHYNFIRRHMTIKTTPAIKAGITDRYWTMLDFVELMEREESANGGRLTDYKPSASIRRGN